MVSSLLYKNGYLIYYTPLALRVQIKIDIKLNVIFWVSQMAYFCAI